MELKNLEKAKDLSIKLNYLQEIRENLMSLNEKDLLITIQDASTTVSLYESYFKTLNKIICCMTIDTIDLQIKDVESEIYKL